MLSYKNRIKSQENFAEVFQKGAFFSFGLVSLRVKRNNLGYSRLGISVGLKFSKKAVQRNTLKRRLRAVFFALLPQLEENLDIVVMVQKEKKEKGVPDYNRLKNDLKKALKKGKLLNK